MAKRSLQDNAATSKPLLKLEGEYIGSSKCQTCHPKKYDSWQLTYHSKMTQAPTQASILGEFDGAVINLGNATIKPFRREDRYFFEIRKDNDTRVAEVALAVGARRYQQYFESSPAESGTLLERLPLLWHVQSKKWLPLVAVFLGPDQDNIDAHRSTWNDNCILCHNTGPRPEAVSLQTNGSHRGFRSTVSELGIACESCHGPGKTHSEKMPQGEEKLVGGNLLDAPSIVNPENLDKARAVSVCGQCHGQRLPKTTAASLEWKSKGPSFKSGQLLSDHAEIVEMNTAPTGKDVSEIALRFWQDGTPRLTAYEYQGITSSRCFQKSEMTCGSCHAMHNGDVLGQMASGMRSNAACSQCHEGMRADVAAHTKHKADGIGSQCVSCHMPKIVYGVLSLHRSHRIEIPNATRDEENNRPNACTLCHLNRSAEWASSASARLWGRSTRDGMILDANGSAKLEASVRSILSGDAAQRAVYAAAMGQRDVSVDPRDKAILRLALVVSLADPYPTIRWLAQQSLDALEREYQTPLGTALSSYDHLAPQEVRTKVVRDMLSVLSTISPSAFNIPPKHPLMDNVGALNMLEITRMLSLQTSRAISIGE